jgi:hypothetical protein
MPVILASWEAGIGKISVPGQLGQIVCETPIFKITRTEWTRDVVLVLEGLLWK